MAKSQEEFPLEYILKDRGVWNSKRHFYFFMILSLLYLFLKQNVFRVI